MTRGYADLPGGVPEPLVDGVRRPLDAGVRQPPGDGVRISQTDVRMDADPALRPERDAVPGSAGPRRPRRRGERLMVPKAEFGSYYGRPVIKPPTWSARDIGSYLFLGGLAGASSTLAAAADVTGRPALARVARTGAVAALGGSLYALIHDLGRPERFLNMLRVMKPTSPMSVGSWLLAGYGPPAVAAAASALTGRLPRLGRAAGLVAGLLGPAVAAYTGALISDTSVPAWHEGYREMPFAFVGSAAASAGGLALLGTPPDQSGPARRAAVGGAALEIGATRLMRARLGGLSEPLRGGLAGRLLRAGEVLSLTGAAGALLGRRRLPAMLAGGALLAGSACTRLGIFHAGVASARDPRYTVAPQRARLDRRATE